MRRWLLNWTSRNNESLSLRIRQHRKHTYTTRYSIVERGRKRKVKRHHYPLHHLNETSYKVWKPIDGRLTILISFMQKIIKIYIGLTKYTEKIKYCSFLTRSIHCEAKTAPFYFGNNCVNFFYSNNYWCTYTLINLQQNDIKIINIFWRLSSYRLVKCSIRTRVMTNVVLSRKLKRHSLVSWTFKWNII